MRFLDPFEDPETDSRRRKAPMEDVPYDTDAQLDEVADMVRFHRMADTAQSMTDRQLNLPGILCAYEEDAEAGAREFPSGAVVYWQALDDDTTAPDVSGQVLPSDLPAGTSEYVERMSPHKQPARERWLAETWPVRQPPAANGAHRATPAEPGGEGGR